MVNLVGSMGIVISDSLVRVVTLLSVIPVFNNPPLIIKPLDLEGISPTVRIILAIYLPDN